MRFPILFALTGAVPLMRPFPHATSEPTVVEIKTFQFAPDTVRVKVGAKVTFANRDDIEHTVTAGTPEARNPAFNKTLNAKGVSVEVTFDRPGTYAYFCDRHQFMRGAITVTR